MTNINEAKLLEAKYGNTFMKYILFFLLCVFAFIQPAVFAQSTETFDLSTFKPPARWKKQASESAVQFVTEDAATNASCIIMVSKAIPGTNDSAENFKLAWENVIKEMVNVSTAPEMQPVARADGWEAQTGIAPFQNEDGSIGGVVMLLTSSGYGKMVNIIIITNTEEYEKNIADFLESLSFKKPPGETAKTPEKVKPVQTTSANPANPGNFQFSTTNFDDGWTSTIQEDWVLATKGAIRVLIHYPNKQADDYNPVLLDGLKNAWDILVAPRYSSASNFVFKPIQDWQSVEFAEADMIEKGTGKTVHVVLFKKNYSNGSGKYLEFITPDKRAFEQEFGAYRAAPDGWEKMEKMANYNKFAVAPSDLKGKWTNNFSRTVQYANIYTGAIVGASTYGSGQNFVFGAGNTYQWDFSSASGFAGNMKLQSVKSSGKFSVPNNWQVSFSDIEGKPRTYNAQFTAVKGARILWLDGTAFGKIE